MSIEDNQVFEDAESRTSLGYSLAPTEASSSHETETSVPSNNVDLVPTSVTAPTLEEGRIEESNLNIAIDTSLSTSTPVEETNSIERGAPGKPVIVQKKLNGYVGFANLPNQWHRKSIRKGFSLNIMVVGESGLGKSTLIETLFNMSLYGPKTPRQPGHELAKTIEIESVTADIEENGVRLHLTVVDTPGFGDFVNNTDSWKTIIDNIDARFDAYLDAENKPNRVVINDDRIHACIYFIQPTGHSLSALDITVLKQLHRKVNIIPVIAKSDMLTDEELLAFKSRILADIAHQGIEIFQPPKYDNDDEETQLENEEIFAKSPFAVVGSSNLVQAKDGRMIRGRSYPWGVIEVDNEEHCDFVKLRQLLIRTHLEELRERTANQLYEQYRTNKLLELGMVQDTSVFMSEGEALSNSARLEQEISLHKMKLAKMESEMKSVFQQKVAEKEQKLKRSEAELFARHHEMKQQLEAQRLELEERKARLEHDRPVEEKKTKKFSLR
ncbi:Septin [Nadsonia fulvescens var. elongata DSM 6958]|uniref:Septin n=1 Tax=Nadsonia fulvescens var. elongata DSM 6958 TaxID=857566 RepID=A0A1E3PNW1_9ASCO|nr:Septin [Nadsonia fulvescens var. elongata DSM 6958]